MDAPPYEDAHSVFEPPASSVSILEARVVVHVVTFNHAATIAACLNAATRQEDFVLNENLFIVITDNASDDASVSKVTTCLKPGMFLHRQQENIGFTGAHNKGLGYLEEYKADFLLLLNPDLALTPSCLARLVRTLHADSAAGAVVPKLLRANEDLTPLTPARIDAAGMSMTAAMRHFDRGADQLDTGQFDAEEYVFGGSGACLLLRKSCIEDVSFDDQGPYDQPYSPTKRLFADAFFAYREDAELAWRMQRLGWLTRYQPAAIAYHVRRVTPERRAVLPERINSLGVQNRIFLQLLHLDWHYWRWLPAICIRNLQVLGACLSIEQSSLPGLKQGLAQQSDMRQKRAQLSQRARVSGHQVATWFARSSQSRPALATNVDRAACSTQKPVRSIDVLIINYNSGQRLGTCLQKLSAVTSQIEEEIQIKIVVLDNASSDASAQRVEPLFRALPQFKFIFAETNLGFAGGIQRAAQYSSADALLLLNPDIEINATAIRALGEALNEHSDLAAVAPVLIGEDQVPQYEFCAKSLPTLGATLAELVLLHRVWKSNPWTSAWRIDQDRRIKSYLDGVDVAPGYSVKNPLLIEQPPAACFLVRTEVFNKLGGFDTRFWPAWFEDVDFCKRLQQAGKLCAIIGKSRVRHEGGYSAKSMDSADFRQIWFTNLKCYWLKHGNSLERILISLAIPVGLLLRAGLLGFSEANTTQRKKLISAAWHLSRYRL